MQIYPQFNSATEKNITKFIVYLGANYVRSENKIYIYFYFIINFYFL